MIKERSTLWLFLAIIVYSFAHFIWYWQTPLGQSPVLDGQENLILASQIAEGSLSKEPFYRAILYPALLAAIPIHWMVLGFALHLSNALLVFQISKTVWKNKHAGLFSAALIGLNPVLLHFAADPLDITLSITLFLGSILAAANGVMQPDRALRCFATSGLLLSLASLTRPHFFALLIPLFLVGLLLSFINKSARTRAFAFIIPIGLLLLTFGSFQKVRSDSFRVLPWQGAFNLWASNHPGANGLYFTQSLSFHYTSEHQNPARLESEELYRRETGKEPQIDVFNQFWKAKAFDAILEDPTAWLELMLFKSYALLNNEEQYNNKTYRFHKALSPALRFNPIGWGLLLILTAIAIPRLYQKQPSLLLIFFCGFALFAAGVLLYMASARFRLPLVPILAILSGSAGVVFADVRKLKFPRLGSISLILALAAALLGFTRFGKVRSDDTFVQDAMLLADASAKLGRDAEAFHWSNKALTLSPERADAKRLRLISFYNRVAFEDPSIQSVDWSPFASDLDSPLSDPILEYVKGVALWNLSQPQAAQGVWRASFDTFGWEAQASLSALIYTDSLQLPTEFPPLPANQTTNFTKLVFAIDHASNTNDASLNQLKVILANIKIQKEALNVHARVLSRVLPKQN